mgnify:CR=1 FL=1
MFNLRSAFANLEEDIAYFKAKREVIIFGDMKARTKSLQLDAQQISRPHISRCKRIHKCIVVVLWMKMVQIISGSYYQKYATVVPKFLLQMVCCLTLIVLYVKTQWKSFDWLYATLWRHFRSHTQILTRWMDIEIWL